MDVFRIGAGKKSKRTRTYENAEPFQYSTKAAHNRIPFSKTNWTCEHEPYRYPIDESPKDPWERCFNAVDKSDEELCKDLKDEISYLLVVASLFLAIVASFTIESFSWLREDQGQDATFLLGQLVRMMNDSTLIGSAQELPPSTPAPHELVVNQLWFLSMTLSLSAVVAGTLCLQWLSAFRRTDVKHVPHDDALALRQLRYEGLMNWGVPRVPAILLLTVQGALILFAIGLLYLLWNVNRHVALPVAIVSGISVLFLSLTSLMPLLQSLLGWILPQTLAITQCPYKSPISWVIHRAGVLLAVLVTLPVIWIPWLSKLSEWHHDQAGLLTDYLWQRFDELWRKHREDYGPQSSKSRSSRFSYTDKPVKYSHYLVRGLASAMETLVFQPSAVHIIHTCLQEFHGTKAEVETFENLFNKDFTKAEEGLLQAAQSGGADMARIEYLRRDFLNAHALQHFVDHNKNLHRILLPHRVELYIRIKNTARGLAAPVSRDRLSGSQHKKKQDEQIGASVGCPIKTLRDAQYLVPELRIQFLKCAEHLIGTNQFGAKDAYGAALVLNVSQGERNGTVLQDGGDELSMESRWRRVLVKLDEHLSDTPTQDQPCPPVSEPDTTSRKHAPTPPTQGESSDAPKAQQTPSPTDHGTLYEKIKRTLEKSYPGGIESLDSLETFRGARSKRRKSLRVWSEKSLPDPPV